MDKNMVLLTGVLAGVSQRSVGTAGRSLTEVRVTVTKPAARGREAETMAVPVIVWQPELGLARRDARARDADRHRRARLRAIVDAGRGRRGENFHGDHRREHPHRRGAGRV
jgi:hypothetical protein